MCAHTDSDSTRPRTYRSAYRSVAPLLAGLATGVLLGLHPATAAQLPSNYCSLEGVRFFATIGEGWFRLTTAAGLVATLGVVYGPALAAALNASDDRLRRLYRFRLDHVRNLALLAVIGPAVATLGRWLDVLLLECFRVVVVPW